MLSRTWWRNRKRGLFVGSDEDGRGVVGRHPAGAEPRGGRRLLRRPSPLSAGLQGAGQRAEIFGQAAADEQLALSVPPPDRKSTRLNSSHGYISYAVFCLKKNNHIYDGPTTHALPCRPSCMQ